jgi:DNA gyrase/topoisomerase IV subunit B
LFHREPAGRLSAKVGRGSSRGGWAQEAPFGPRERLGFASPATPTPAPCEPRPQVEVWRGDSAFEQSFCRGAATGPLASRRAGPGEPRSGTRVEFLFDRTVFSQGVAWEPETVVARLRELAFLNPSATLRLRTAGGKAAAAGARRRRETDGASGDEGRGGGGGSGGGGGGSGAGAAADTANGAGEEGWQVFHYEGGLQEYVQW